VLLSINVTGNVLQTGAVVIGLINNGRLKQYVTQMHLSIAYPVPLPVNIMCPAVRRMQTEMDSRIRGSNIRECNTLASNGTVPRMLQLISGGTRFDRTRFLLDLRLSVSYAVLSKIIGQTDLRQA